jgi:hypothetical protein
VDPLDFQLIKFLESNYDFSNEKYSKVNLDK